MATVAVLDVGGTSIKTGVVDVDQQSRGAGAVTIGASVPTRATEEADVVLGQLATAIDSALGAGPLGAGRSRHRLPRAVRRGGWPGA